ncbi:short-chain dehydrogenase [Streptomyces sp. CMB-StM0423]|nr:short-chain dehydrogenase [Streptomyces sp. CMB-StM0423]
MTGASRGIGRAAAEHLLRTAPDVHLLVVTRGPSGAALAAELAGDGPTPYAVSHIEADLGSLAAVRSAAAAVRDRLDRGDLPPLRGFVGNAGIQYTDALTAGGDGYEATFTVNVLANHLFVRLLQDRFTAPARIVITSSDTHFGDFRHNLGMVPGPVWQDPDALARPGAFAKPGTAAAGRTAYSTSKLATLYLVHEYARRLPAGVTAVAYNPGFVPATGLTRNAGPVTRFVTNRLLPALTLTPFATSRDTAARHLAALALGTLDAPTGAYVDRDRVADSSPESYDPTRESALWTTAERLTTAHPATTGQPAGVADTESVVFDGGRNLVVHHASPR